MSNKSKSGTKKEAGKRELKPKLRFPEFRDAPAWQPATLTAVADLKNGYAFKSSTYVESGDYHIITIANVQSGWLTLETTKRIANLPSDIQSHQKLAIGDILISMTGNVGRIARVDSTNLLLNQRVGKLVPHDIYDDFFYHTLQNDSFRTAMQLKAAGGAQGNLSSADIGNYVLANPTCEKEQKKIAECLSSLDESITAHSRKLDALKAHKKGLMQQLFPREGETLPRLRFPKFKEAPEWEEKKLDDMAQRASGHTPSKSNADHYAGGIKWISLADSKRLDKGLISETATEISELGIKNSSAVLHPAGTVLLSRDAGVGKSAVMACPMAVSRHFIVWVCDKKKLSNWFLYYLLQHNKQLFESIATGSTIKTIGLPFFKSLKMRFPLPEEQERVANTLLSVEELITAQSQKVNALKTHKKGVMQQLFPTIEEA